MCTSTDRVSRQRKKNKRWEKSTSVKYHYANHHHFICNNNQIQNKINENRKKYVQPPERVWIISNLLKEWRRMRNNKIEKNE